VSVSVPLPSDWKCRCAFAFRTRSRSSQAHTVFVCVSLPRISACNGEEDQMGGGRAIVLVYSLMHPRFGHCPSGIRACCSVSRNTTRALGSTPSANSPRSLGIACYATFTRRKRVVKRVPPPPFVVSMLGLALAWAGGVLETRGGGRGEDGEELGWV
jgi:hypothetical protein